MSTTAGVTTGALARRLGVSPTTLRSWDRRYGIGPPSHEGGRHRRWQAEDVAVVEEMCRLTATGVPPAEAARAARAERRGAAVHGGHAPPSPAPVRNPGAGLPLGDVTRECRGLARAAVRLDAPAMDGLLHEALRDHGPERAWQDVMAPTLHAVGRKWQSSGERYIEVEHLLSWQVSTALRSVPFAGTTARAQAPPALLACVPGEQHLLALEALVAALRTDGVPHRMFGAALPADALEEAVRRTGPTAVVLWSQSRATATPALARHIGAAEWGVRGARTRPLVVTAGPGWAGRRVPGAVRPASLPEAAALLRSAAVRALGAGR